MRFIPLFAATLTLSLAASTAAATVTEPDGTMVPQPSADAIQLNQYFATQGETINWQTDAAATPNAFSPLCGFTATFVLHQADCALDFAWYNETGTTPPATDLHVLVPAGSAVGTMFTGTSIKSDPAYKGGLVGFALVGDPFGYCTDTHYSNAAYDTQCAFCTPVAPWITALIYPSTKTPNAFYVAFEDGPTSSYSFGNDGDFNDDVYFLTGITCSGGGQPCDTGRQGICASGITQCTATGTTCQQLTQPATETCNGLDDNCNGTVDEGAICPTGEVCQKGTCVQSCSGGEITCPPGLVCASDGYCVDAACVSVTCASGTVCVAGVCKGPCDGVVCPSPQVCRVGVCLDPCAGVTCGQGQVCDNGVCVTSCSCLPCATGKACDATSGLCVAPACATKTCAAGTTCVAGNCVDDCTGAVCPTGQTCTAGQCVASASGTGGSSSSGVMFGNGGSGGGTQSGGTGAASGTQSGGTGAASGTQSGGTGGVGGATGNSNGRCGCRVAGDSEGGELALLGLAVAVAAMRRRRA